MLEVRPVEKRGCAWVAGSVFSLGLLPLLAARQARDAPAQLTDEAMILRNGLRIPWSQFTRVTATDVYLNRRYIRTRYVLKHTGGQVAIENDGVHDADLVIRYVLDHVPAEALSA